MPALDRLDRLFGTVEDLLGDRQNPSVEVERRLRCGCVLRYFTDGAVVNDYTDCWHQVD